MLSRRGPVEGRRATELVYDAFVELVTRHRLFHYRDLGFLDEGAQTRAVGQANGTVILFAEKDGRFALVRDIAQAYDATALALGGYPSSLATEYLVHALQQAGVLAERPALQLFAVVDYDPSGYWIAREFTAQLNTFGVQEVTLHPLIRPERLTTEQVALGRYTLPKGSKTTNWVRETGGIDGEPYGLEADAFAPDVIRAAFVAAATPYLHAFRPLDGLCTLLEETARRRLDALPLEAVVAQIAAMEAGELLALARHLRPRLVPSEEPPAAAVAERIVQMTAEELAGTRAALACAARCRGLTRCARGASREPWEKTLRVEVCAYTPLAYAIRPAGRAPTRHAGSYSRGTSQQCSGEAARAGHWIAGKSCPPPYPS